MTEFVRWKYAFNQAFSWCFMATYFVKTTWRSHSHFGSLKAMLSDWLVSFAQAMVARFTSRIATTSWCFGPVGGITNDRIGAFDRVWIGFVSSVMNLNGFWISKLLPVDSQNSSIDVTEWVNHDMGCDSKECECLAASDNGWIQIITQIIAGHCCFIQKSDLL